MEVVIIKNEKYTYIKNYKSSKKERDSFNELSGKVFDLNFEGWYRGGYWQDQYIPYSLMHENKVVANVSVNIMDFKVFGEVRHYIQIGTVMTDPDYRHRGLSKFLMEKVLNEWETQCDSIYLFANDSARDFYPQFGFEEAVEYQCTQLIHKKDTEVVVRRLDVNNAEDLGLLLKCYQQSNPFSALSMEKNVGLLMFYCSSFMKEDIYYMEGYDTVVIATFDEENMILHDLFGEPKVSLEEIINSVARTSTQTVVFGFTPKQVKDYASSLLEEEDLTLFVMKDKENIFNKYEVMFPTLSHA